MRVDTEHVTVALLFKLELVFLDLGIMKLCAVENKEFQNPH